MIKRKKTKQGGFTLIELLVVIAIIGILASIVLTSLNTGRKKARDARRQSDIRQIALAMEMSYDDAEAYVPIAVDASSQLTTTDITVGTTKYLSIPKDPTTTNGAYYGVDNSSDLQKYCIWAKLETPNPAKYEVASETGVTETTTLPSGLGASCH